MSALVTLLFALLQTARAAQCPTGDAGWAAWASRQARSAAEAPGSGSVLAPIAGVLDACRAQWKALPKAACLAPLDRHAHALTWYQQEGHSLNMGLSDSEYYRTVPYPEMLELPELLRRPQFLQRLDTGDRASLDELHDWVAKEHPEWRTFEYRSQHLYTPDGTSALGRFFVYVPGTDFDRYLQFGLRDNPNHPLPNGVSIVGVQKTDPRTHRPLAVPQAYIIDRWRKRDSSGIHLTTRLAVNGRVESCYECHKSPVLPITPDPAVFQAERFGKAVAQVNRAMARYGKVVPAGWDVYAYGPALGPRENPERTDAFLRACAGDGVRPERLGRLREAMQCTSCHNGDKRGALNFPSARRRQPLTNVSLVESYIVRHRRMPPGSRDLTDDERIALFRCLSQEYYGAKDHPGLLERWLANAECFSR